MRLSRERMIIAGLAGAIVGTSALLNGWGLAAIGWGNAYYSAAVRSMGTSWHSLLYASFDRGGYVSVDKPPFAMWVQVLSSKLFGYSRLALLIPEVLAGAAAVGLVFWGLRRTWGATAGLVAAAVLALTPINVMINHSNNTDAVLVLLMTAAAVTAMEAIRGGRLRWLIAACVLAGCAMTTKMLAAAPVMPGILVAAAWCSPGSWRRRLRDVAIGAVTMAIAGLWWFVVVQATPAHDRPYVGSTRTNSVFELAFERNGLRQVEGLSSLLPPGPRDRERASQRPGPPIEPPIQPPIQPPVEPPIEPPIAPAVEAPILLGGSNQRSAGIGGLGFNSGVPGVTRLVNSELGGQIGWMLPLAIVGAVAALWSTGWRRSPRLGAVLVLGCWFGATAIVFSFTKGVLHPYYLGGLGPPTAGLVGVGVSTLRFDLEAGRRRSVLGFIALVLTVVVQWIIWRRFDWRTWWIVVAVAAMLAVLAFLAVSVARLWRSTHQPISRRRSITSVVAMTVAAALAPAMWVQGSLAAGVNATLPFAQPVHAGHSGTTGNGITPNGGFQFPSLSVPALVRYLREHASGERWMLAVQSAGPAEEVIISSGASVMAIGGFIGSDPIETAAALRRRVHDGEVRYFLLSITPSGVIPGLFGEADTVRWIPTTCRVIPDQVWARGASEDTARPGTQAFPGGPTAATFRLFDCAGV